MNAYWPFFLLVYVWPLSDLESFFLRALRLYPCFFVFCFISAVLVFIGLDTWALSCLTYTATICECWWSTEKDEWMGDCGPYQLSLSVGPLYFDKVKAVNGAKLLWLACNRNAGIGFISSDINLLWFTQSWVFVPWGFMIIHHVHIVKYLP